MPSDASIYSMIRPVQPGPGPMAQYGRAAQIGAMLDSQELSAMQRAQLMRQMEQENAVNTVFSRLQPGQDVEAVLPDVMRASPKAGMALQGQLLDQKAKRATIGKTEAEAKALQVKQQRDQLATVQDDAGLALAREIAMRLHGPNAVAGMPQSVSDPNFQAWRERQVMDASEFLKRVAPQYSVQDFGGSKGVVQANPNATGGVTGLQPKTATPGELLTDERTRTEGAANRGVTLRGQNLADARARESTGAGRIPPGYRMKADGSMEAIPGGPADAKVDQKAGETKRTLDAYVAARDGLLSALESSDTGPIAGRMPAYTAAQQTAEGGVSAMAPVLKQLFRVAGEGVFTDRDQALLLQMVPTRADRPDARAAKIANIDNIVSAKLGMSVPTRTSSKGTIGGVDPKKLSNEELLLELNR